MMLLYAMLIQGMSGSCSWLAVGGVIQGTSAGAWSTTTRGGGELGAQRKEKQLLLVVLPRRYAPVCVVRVGTQL
jgi:hypothetical protein